MIWFGGICCVPIACRRNENTTISLTKLVITSSREGANTKRVKTIRTLRELTKSLGSLGAERDISIVGTVTASAPKAESAIRDIKITAFKMAILR